MSEMNFTNYEKKYLDASIHLMASLQSEELTLDDLCRILSLTTLKSFPGSKIFIFKLNAGATISLISSFGVPDEFRKNRQNIPLSMRIPVCHVMSSNEPIWITKSQNQEELFPDLRNISNRVLGDFICTIPIRKFGVPIGSLTIVGTVLPETENFKIFLELLGLMVASRFSASGNFIELLSQGVKAKNSLSPLTDREILIQKNMKKGLTNAQIALELGYSESTIRQAAVILFDKLGVSNRMAAGDLLPDEPKPTEETLIVK